MPTISRRRLTSSGRPGRRWRLAITYAMCSSFGLRSTTGRRYRARGRSGTTCSRMASVSRSAQVVFSPGHTLASITYVIGDAAFVHDTLFMPDSGTARTDFPGGDAKQLWNSIQVILALPDQTRVFTGHDYQPGGRHPRWESTVSEQKRSNTHIAGKTEDRFVDLRQERDRTLPMPKLILPALQVNIRGGRRPHPAGNGPSYRQIPLDLLPGRVLLRPWHTQLPRRS